MKNSPVPTQPRRVRCTVVEASPQPQSRIARDLLPWADPYIASLVAALRREEQEMACHRRGCAQNS